MEIHIEKRGNTPYALVKSEGLVIRYVEEAVDLLGNCDYQGASKIILRKEQITEAFFDLRTGIAGEILQKFSNYRKQLAIVGDFSIYTSKSLRDFIYESNRSRQIFFVGTLEEAVEKLSGN